MVTDDALREIERRMRAKLPSWEQEDETVQMWLSDAVSVCAEMVKEVETALVTTQGWLRDARQRAEAETKLDEAVRCRCNDWEHWGDCLR